MPPARRGFLAKGQARPLLPHCSEAACAPPRAARDAAAARRYNEKRFRGRQARVTIQQNTDRIQTTHIGSLPRPRALLDMMKRKFAGESYDEAAYEAMLRQAVMETVRKQKDCGIDIVTDGEFSKPGFFTYVQERLDGFEARPDRKLVLFQKEVAAFPEYYQEYFKQAMMGGAVVPVTPVVCTGPIRYRGEAAVQRDIANVKAAAKAAGIPDHHVFLPATSPTGVGANEYYKSDEDYLQALAAELGKEYRAITDAGLLLQVDDPFLPDIFVEPDLDEAQMRRRAQICGEAVNAALAGIPREKVRYHTCYGINEGPRLYEASLAQIIEHMLKIDAGSFSFEAANPRHEHEYHLFESVKIPEGVVLCPGVVTHASNIVEHPELIAERLIRYANLVGRENVMAGADCGFSSQALYKTEVHDSVVWEKFKAMREGADIASRKLWR
jgi:5-methyltetrahydropteroyltriglutamate--homocysteine methyltransferase